SATGCAHASIAGVSGSVVTVHMTRTNTQTFKLTYGGVTVPGQPGVVTFSVQTADGTVGQDKHGLGSLHPIATSPLLTVSGNASGETGGQTSGTTSGTRATHGAVEVGCRDLRRPDRDRTGRRRAHGPRLGRHRPLHELGRRGRASRGRAADERRRNVLGAAEDGRRADDHGYRHL